MSIQLTVTRSSNPDAEAERIIQALRSGETVVCTGSGRSHHRRLRHGVDGVDRILYQIDVLVTAELPSVKPAGHAHGRNGLRVWTWSPPGEESAGFAFFTPDVIPGHAYFPDGTPGGDAVWVQDADGA